MKPILTILVCILIVSRAAAQYYYKDIIVSQQASRQIQKYREKKVHAVKLSSFESDGQPTEKFSGSQQIDNNFTKITTRLSSALAGSSELTSNFDRTGLLTSSHDTTDGSGSTTNYFYNNKNELSKLINLSVSPGARTEKEIHLWAFENGRPVSMMRIKDNSDTTFIKFVLDEKSNVVEENSIRKGTRLPSFYYYYDDQNRLTDVVSYNIRAKRLLPAYLFEYNEDGSLKTMMVVPEGSSDYQKWYYEYRDGLKIKETAFNKKKQLLGRIEYNYE